MAEKLTSLEMNYILVQRQVEFGNMLLELNQPEGDTSNYQNLAQAAETCPGGQLVSYAKQLLADSKAGKNPYHGFAPPFVPSAKVSTLGDEKLHQVEEAGVREATKAAFVFVAGGLRDCLSYNGIKVALPGESTTVTCFLRQYIVRYNLVLQDPDCWINPDDYNVYMAANDSFMESLKVRMMDYRFLVRRGLFNYIKGVYKREEDTYEAMGLPRDLKKPGDSLTYRYLLSTFFGL